MARTPLLSALRSLFYAARVARARGVPLEAVLDSRPETGVGRPVSRRTFLASAGAAAAVLNGAES
jgi:hypothetical protein